MSRGIVVDHCRQRAGESCRAVSACFRDVASSASYSRFADYIAALPTLRA